MLYGVEAQHPRTITSGPGGGGYSPQGVHFEGWHGGAPGTYLHRTSLAATDNGDFSFSFWIKNLNDNTNGNSWLWAVDPNGADAIECGVKTHSLQNYLYFQFANNAFTLAYWAEVGPINTAGWHHVLGSSETNHAAGLKLLTVYIDDVLQSHFTTHDPNAAFVSNFNAKEFFFADFEGSHGFFGDLADAWLAPGITLIDETAGTISEPTRRQFTDFITGTGCIPIDPTTFPSSAILFSGDAAAFVTNQGTGGGFTLTGSLTNASTDPP